MKQDINKVNVDQVNWLKEFKKHTGLNTKDIAQLLGATYGAVNKWEAGLGMSAATRNNFKVLLFLWERNLLGEWFDFSDRKLPFENPVRDTTEEARNKLISYQITTDTPKTPPEPLPNVI